MQLSMLSVFGAEGLPIGLTLGPIQLEHPIWLLAAVPAAAWTVWLGRRAMRIAARPGMWSAIDPFALRAGLAARLGLLIILSVILAGPNWERASEEVATVFVLDTSQSIPEIERRRAEWAIDTAATLTRGSARLGMVTAAAEPFVQRLPAQQWIGIPPGGVGVRDETDLGSAVRLALALRPADAAMRIVLVSDGNETSGSVLDAVREASAAGVVVDTVPIEYQHEAEVVAERLIAPSSAREGQEIELTLVLTASAPTEGRVYLTENGRVVTLTASGAAMPVELDAGRTILRVTIPAGRSGTKRYRARFEPGLAESGSSTGDAIAENNEALGVTFVSGRGRVLVVRSSPDDSVALVEALTASGLGIEPIEPEMMPTDFDVLAGYDAVVLVDQPAFAFTDRGQADLARYVADAGGGLIVVGGPDSFGAGGWIGSPLADALPIRLDPPERRELPRGALSIVIDRSGSMGRGVANGPITQLQLAIGAALSATETLSRRDLIAIVVFDGEHEFVVPMTPNDPESVRRRIRRIELGGGTNMFPAVDAARMELERADAGLKHMIVLSDGQTRGAAGGIATAAQRLIDAGITATTIAIGDDADDQLMRSLAEATGGRFHKVAGPGMERALPQVFAMEARTVRRSLIWEGDPFSPLIVEGGSEGMQAIDAVPPISGYVVAADRNGLSRVTLRGHQHDPILAQWQHGLGRALAFTSDAGDRWATEWTSWEGYEAFWEQHVRWAMRPSGSANLRVLTERQGDSTLVAVDGVDDRGERLDTGRLEARLSSPLGQSLPLDLRQVGPGRWEGRASTAEPGTYVATVRYAAPEGSPMRIRGVAQTAITVEPGRELRALRSDRSTLERAAQLARGRVLDLDSPDAWSVASRTGLEMPISRSPLWLPLTLVAMVLLLVDVAVRRIRVDLGDLAARTVRALKPGRVHASEEFESLRRARDHARHGFENAIAQGSDAAGSSSRDIPKPESVPLDRITNTHADEPGADTGAPHRRTPSTAQTQAVQEHPEPDEPDDAGLNRLMAAKKRAGGRLAHDDDPTP